MRVMKYIILTLFFVVSLGAFSQKDTVKRHNKDVRLKISEVNIFTGDMSFPNVIDDFETFRKTAKDPSLIGTFDDYEKAVGYDYISYFGINIALSPYRESDNTYNHYKKILLGINFKNGNRQVYRFTNEEFYTTTNLTDASGTVNYDLDSTIQASYQYTEAVQEIALNTAFLFYTNPQAQTSLHTGIGANVGFSLNSNIIETVELDTTWSIAASGNERYYLDEDDSYNYDYNYYDSKGSLFLRAYIPVGIDVRLSKKADVLKQLSLFYQFLFGIEYQHVYGVTSYTRMYWCSEFGIRHFF